MRVVFLVINYMPHQLVSIKSIINYGNAEVHSFNYKDVHTTPKNITNFFSYEFKSYNRSQLLNKILEINPVILVVAGWAVKDFVWVSKQIKIKLGIPVVSYSDTQWRNTWKQKINVLLSPFYIRRAFSHLWVAGIYQYEYARKLGFSKDKIIYNSLSCDLELFMTVPLKSKVDVYPKNFLFVGRFVPVKGLDLLLEAWNQILDKKGWSLTLVGDSLDKVHKNKLEGVTIKDSMSQKELLKEFENSGCFLITSKFDQWALVIHEASASGLPIIATDVCGAAAHFVVNGYNGFQVKPNVRSIKLAIEKVLLMDDNELLKFSDNSKNLSRSITPELCAAQLMSVLNGN